MEVRTLDIAGVLLLGPRYFVDARGYFVETYSTRSAHAAGVTAAFVQDNQALSLKRGTVRALHFQVRPKPQAKLVRALRGSIYDVAVDLRFGSPSYGKWVAATLTAQGGEQMFVPRGFAHGYCTLEDDTEVAYKVDNYYAPECEQGLAWDDPTLAVRWPVSSTEAVLSDKDRGLQRFADFASSFRYNGVMTKRFLITGGAGFIGSAVVRHLIHETDHRVCVVDKLTYAGNLRSLLPIADNLRYAFVRADITESGRINDVFASFRPDVVMHLAAESHVDRSIDGPAEFIQTNIVGTYSLLEVALRYWRALPRKAQTDFRFHHISTDEVFGSLAYGGCFDEATAYAPRSPYSASKAASDHLVRAWHHTYGLPVLVTNCSNNYGPYHFPEKLIPLTIINGLEGLKLPVYGAGTNVRDWLYVEDHVRALLTVVGGGRLGETYCIGGRSERTNLDVVREICVLLDELAPSKVIGRRENLIAFVADRPGHDVRYAIDPTRICDELSWQPRETFETGLRKTVQWYLGNRDWWQRIRDNVYGGERLGVPA